MMTQDQVNTERQQLLMQHEEHKQIVQRHLEAMRETIKFVEHVLQETKWVTKP